jgi:hypothetical protein
MKITRDTVAANEWCCDTMQPYFRKNCIYVSFNPEEPTVVINMRSRSVAWADHDESEKIDFCPFCGERLEVEV